MNEVNEMKRGIRLCRKNEILSAFFIVITIASLCQPVTARAAAKPVFDKQTLTLNVKKSKTLGIKNVKKNRIKKTAFKSNKKSVAKVNSKGKVTGVKEGKAVITCRLVLKSGKKYTLKCKVTVRKKSSSKGKATVYMTKDISPDGLMAVYEALGATPKGKVAVKISTGEPGSNYLKPDLIGELVKSLDGTIVECNTAYGGDRASTAMHYQVAKDHGYTAIADVDIMDAKGSMTLTVKGGENLKKNYVGKNFSNYDYYVVLSHFKGHAMAGFGGSIKNISIGIASSKGKEHIHSGGTGDDMWSADQDVFLESMAEAGKSVADYLNGNILYINVMNRLSVDCDCDSSPAKPCMHDIGILASYDPVALDQACVDLVYAAEDGAKLVKRIESRNGLHTLEHAEKIGLGSRKYRLKSID